MKKKAYTIVLGTYVLLWLFRLLEYLFIRTDRGLFGEAFIHKILGIVFLGIILNRMYFKWADIGFSKKGRGKNLFLGSVLGIGTFTIAYVVEMIIANQGDSTANLKYFITNYSLSGEGDIRDGLSFLLICIIGNLINVVMEEGIFRGLYLKVLEKENSFTKSMIISSLLFGFWHIAAPFRELYDGKINFNTFFILSIIQILLTGIMGIQLCLLVKTTGSLWSSLSVHFVNNFVVNILHVVTISGVDQFQSIRISIAQTVSFILVAILFYKNKSLKKMTFRN